MLLIKNFLSFFDFFLSLVILGEMTAVYYFFKCLLFLKSSFYLKK
jgi:hypothetical protein